MWSRTNPWIGADSSKNTGPSSCAWRSISPGGRCARPSRPWAGGNPRAALASQGDRLVGWNARSRPDATLKDFVAVVVLHVRGGDGVVLHPLDPIVLEDQAGPTAVVQAGHATFCARERFFELRRFLIIFQHRQVAYRARLRLAGRAGQKLRLRLSNQRLLCDRRRRHFFARGRAPTRLEPAEYRQGKDEQHSQASIA